MCEKYVKYVQNTFFEGMCKTHFWREHLCALQISLCALVSRPVCMPELRGNIALLSNAGSHACSRVAACMFWIMPINRRTTDVSLLTFQRSRNLFRRQKANKRLAK